MIKLLVFDFDGTLADTRKLTFDIIKSALKEADHGLNDSTIIKNLGNAPMENTLNFLGMNKNKIPYLVEKIEKMLLVKNHKIKMIKDIDYLKKIKIKKVILSNNISRFISETLESKKIDYFDGVYGSENLESKNTRFKKILKKYKVKSEEVAYFGDKPVDVNVAREIGCFSIIFNNSISWGEIKEIKEANPDFIIKNIKEIKEILKKLNSK